MVAKVAFNNNTISKVVATNMEETHNITTIRTKAKAIRRIVRSLNWNLCSQVLNINKWLTMANSKILSNSLLKLRRMESNYLFQLLWSLDNITLLNHPKSISDPSWNTICLRYKIKSLNFKFLMSCNGIPNHPLFVELLRLSFKFSRKILLNKKKSLKMSINSWVLSMNRTSRTLSWRINSKTDLTKNWRPFRMLLSKNLFAAHQSIKRLPKISWMLYHSMKKLQVRSLQREKIWKTKSRVWNSLQRE